MSLRYVTDSSPGISRLRRKSRGKKPSFSYKTATGRPVRDKATLHRIRALAIPPAYDNVWICPQSATGPLLALLKRSNGAGR